jgi:hypothetical protein
VHLTFETILTASSDANSTALIESKLTQAINIELLSPEPGVFGLLACGAPLLLRRRRGGPTA